MNDDEIVPNRPAPSSTTAIALKEYGNAEIVLTVPSPYGSGPGAALEPPPEHQYDKADEVFTHVVMENGKHVAMSRAPPR